MVGGGYIGLEMGLVYRAWARKVSVVEFFPRLLMGADHDLVDVMVKHGEQAPGRRSWSTPRSQASSEAAAAASTVTHRARAARPTEQHYDQVLVAIGRRPNTDDLGLENTKVEVDDAGLHPSPTRSAAPPSRNIFAIGDVAPGPMLAHKASREGKVAAEVIAGDDAAFDNRAIPAVVFTDPEIAWTGLTEREAEEQGIAGQHRPLPPVGPGPRPHPGPHRRPGEGHRRPRDRPDPGRGHRRAPWPAS